jgi:hypothetical protein
MARRPEDRHASVEALAEELRSFLENRGVRARGGGILARGWELLWPGSSRAERAGAEDGGVA